MTYLIIKIKEEKVWFLNKTEKYYWSTRTEHVVEFEMTEEAVDFIYNGEPLEFEETCGVLPVRKVKIQGKFVYIP